jgi:hypothetical protein
MIKYLTSEIDWCENNFVYCNYIAEFWNSLTSCIFIIYGVFGIYKAPIKNNIVNIFYGNNIFIGLTSILFHSTLSIEGQILDEFSILLYILIGSIYLNKHHIKNPIISGLVLFLVPVVVYIYPIMNRFLLFSIGFYIFNMCLKERDYLEKIDKKLVDILYLTRRSFFISLFSWIIDYLCFLPISSHFIWHIFISYVTYLLTVLLQGIIYHRNQKYKDLYIKYYNLLYFSNINIYISANIFNRINIEDTTKVFNINIS